MTRRRRSILPVVLFTIFVIVPIVEIYVIIQVGQVIGAWWTVLLLVVDSIFGAWLIKHEGGRAWRGLREALEDGRMPATELADGALILVGGTLLMTPGFLTDIAGLFCILPFTRPLARRVLARLITRRLVQGFGPEASGLGAPRSRPGRPDRADPLDGDLRDHDVVRGEVVDED